MKQLLFVTILILAGCLAAAAQTANCPEITVTGPSGVTKPGDTMTFTASAGASDQNSKLEYSWTVSSGTIESGQGTSSITVRSTKEMANSNPIATLKMVGFPAGCKDTASDMGAIASPVVCDCSVDEFGRQTRNEVKARIDNFYIRLVNDPESKGFIVVRLNQNDGRNFNKAYINKIYDAIVFLKQDPARVIFAISKEKGDFEVQTTLWLIPRGADSPRLDENSILIKGEDFKQKIKGLVPTK
jgi:hypothetical protein